jgi:3-deoxy-manno-octulosonate cytidylyltransferase (CMP-KDO synthetase)
MKVIAVVPARFASTRFPGKMMAELGGLPLIVRTARQAQKAQTVDEVLVATDDESIFSVVEQAGIPVCMTCADHPSGTDRIAEAMSGRDADVVVNVQGDEPFLDPRIVDGLVERMRAEDQPDMGSACTPILTKQELMDPSVVKVVRNQAGCALYFSRSLIPYSRDEDPEVHVGRNLYFRHLGLYAYRPSFLEAWTTLTPHPLEQTEKLEQLRALANGYSIALIETEQLAPGIDTPEDLKHAEAYLAEHPERS